MIPMDYDIVINPAETKPTTSTVVTDELWMAEVTKAPVIAAETRFLVSFDSNVFIWPKLCENFTLNGLEVIRSRNDRLIFNGTHVELADLFEASEPIRSLQAVSECQSGS